MYSSNVEVLTVECPALLDDKVHGADSLLDGSCDVWPVAEHQVYILKLQALQRRLCVHTLCHNTFQDNEHAAAAVHDVGLACRRMGLLAHHIYQ